jgi:hypothetical protein
LNCVHMIPARRRPATAWGISAGLLLTSRGYGEEQIDQHYYAIASKATILKPSQLNVPTDK